MNTLGQPIYRVAKAAAIALAMLLPAVPLVANAQVYVGVNIGAPPPPLPEYTQPMLTTPGQTWQPGYWAWGQQGYYWVPGTWVTPPSAGLYWTPGYWGYNNGSYAWNNGYWGPQVGYYGGINYGYGYYGTGFTGGYWNNGIFNYNTAVENVNPQFVRTVYTRRVIVPRVVTRYAFNGPGGVRVRPTVREVVVMRERHIGPTALQIEHARVAAADRDLYARYNHGHPRVVAVSRPIRTVNEINRAHVATARAHAATARAQAQTARAHAATARAQEATARARAQTARAHEETTRLHSERERALTKGAYAHASSGEPRRETKKQRPPRQ